MRCSEQTALLPDLASKPLLMSLDPQLCPDPALRVGAAWPLALLIARKVLIKSREVRSAPVLLVQADHPHAVEGDHVPFRGGSGGSLPSEVGRQGHGSRIPASVSY